MLSLQVVHRAEYWLQFVAVSNADSPLLSTATQMSLVMLHAALQNSGQCSLTGRRTYWPAGTDGLVGSYLAEGDRGGGGAGCTLATPGRAKVEISAYRPAGRPPETWRALFRRLLRETPQPTKPTVIFLNKRQKKKGFLSKLSKFCRSYPLLPLASWESWLGCCATKAVAKGRTLNWRAQSIYIYSPAALQQVANFYWMIEQSLLIIYIAFLHLGQRFRLQLR